MIATPQLVEIRKWQSEGVAEFQNVGLPFCDWQRYPSLDAMRAPIEELFDETYAFRMINAETAARWQVLLDRRFHEVADFYDRAFRMYLKETDDGLRVDEIEIEGGRRRTLTESRSGSTETSGESSTTTSGSSETAGQDSDSRTLSGTGSETETIPEKTVTSSGTETGSGTKGIDRDVVHGGTDTVTDTIATVTTSTTTTPTGSEVRTTDSDRMTSDTPDTQLAIIPTYAGEAVKGSSTETLSFSSRQDSVSGSTVHAAPDTHATLHGATEAEDVSETESMSKTTGGTVSEAWDGDREKESSSTETETGSGTSSSTTETSGSSSTTTGGSSSSEGQTEVVEEIVERPERTYLELVNTNLDAWRNLIRSFVTDFEMCFIQIWW